jgi:hypothetical protein
VLTRARLIDGNVTPWYDVSLFFIAQGANSHLGADRVSEGLFHAAQSTAMEKIVSGSDSRRLLDRTSAMVLQQYVNKRTILQFQIQIDSRTIPAPTTPSLVATPEKIVTLGWEAFPNVAIL